jgi:ribulose-5-phosphate 4-epimerase/fuculose-1-phosphate aldolase
VLPISHAGTMFAAGGVTRFDRTGDLITTAELGADLAADLGGADAALMVNHGAVTVGADLAEAVVRAIVLEQACELQILAGVPGGQLISSPPPEAASKLERIWSPAQVEGIWTYLARQLSQPAEARCRS